MAQADTAVDSTVDDRLPGNEWIAIRYNTMTNRAARDKSARTMFLNRRYRYYGISFFTRPNMTAREIAIAIAQHTKVVTGKMRAVVVGDLREAGFQLVDYVPETGHVTLKFAAKPDDRDWERLIALMTPPEPVPFVSLEV